MAPSWWPLVTTAWEAHITTGQQAPRGNKGLGGACVVWAEPCGLGGACVCKGHASLVAALALGVSGATKISGHTLE